MRKKINSIFIVLLIVGCQEKPNSKLIEVQGSTINKKENTMTDLENKNDKIAGTPITSENVADVMEIQRVADAMSNAVDAKDWKLVRSFTTDEVLTSLGKNKPQKIGADDLVAQFEKNLSASEMTSHHMRTNQRVYFHSNNEATMYSKGAIIVNKIPGGEHEETEGKLIIENWISYEHGMVRTSDGWKVKSILTNSLSPRTTSLPGSK